MRRAPARKLGWSSTMRTDVDTSQLSFTEWLPGVRLSTPSRRRTAPRDACQPHWKGARALGVWAGLIQPTERKQMQSKKKTPPPPPRWSPTPRKLAIFGWLAFVVVALFAGSAVGTKELTDAEAVSGEAGRAEVAIENSKLAPNGEVVVVQSGRMKSTDPPFAAAVGEATRELEGLSSVRNVSSPADGGGQVSEDGRSALIEFTIHGDDEEAQERVDASLAATAAVQKAHPDLRVEQFGDASASKAVESAFEEDLSKAEKTSLPVTLIILLVAFGALVAALVPLLIATSAVMATMGLLALPSQLVPMDPNVSSVVVLVGLAVGVDYSLFYLRREREERRAGRSESAALDAAAATSGRAVLVSGLTVITAMAGMLLSGDPTFTSFAVGTMTVVAVAMFASLTVLPAVLSKLGDKVERGRIPFLGRLRQRRAPGQPGVRDADRGQRRRRPAPQHPRGADLRSRHRGLPGRSGERDRGRRGRRRRCRSGGRRDRPAAQGSGGERVRRRSGPRRREGRRHRPGDP